VGIAEADRQKGLVSAIRRQTLSGGKALGVSRMLSGLELDRCSLRAVQLYLPARPSVRAMQHNAGVTNGPTIGRVHELHAGQRSAHRTWSLPPAQAVIIRQQYNAALAHGNQTSAGVIDVQ